MNLNNITMLNKQFSGVDTMRHMKSILVLFLGFSFLAACQQNESPVGPDLDQDSFSLEKKGDNNGRGKGLQDTEDEPTVDLTDPYLNVRWSKTLTVNGNGGGRVAIQYQWKEGPYAGKKVEAELWIPRGAYKGKKTFDMVFDIEALSVELAPAGAFDIPVELTLKFKGLDNNVVKQFKNNPKFKYIDSQGNLMEDVEFKSIDVDDLDGDIKIQGAKLPHFSRYGFVK